MPTSVRIRRERMNEAKRIVAGMRWQKLGTTALTKIVRNNIILFFSFFLLPSFFVFLLVFFRRNWKRSKRDYYSNFLSSNRGEMKKRIITKNNDVRLCSFFFLSFFSFCPLNFFLSYSFFFSLCRNTSQKQFKFRAFVRDKEKFR